MCEKGCAAKKAWLDPSQDKVRSAKKVPWQLMHSFGTEDLRVSEFLSSYRNAQNNSTLKTLINILVLALAAATNILGVGETNIILGGKKQQTPPQHTA